MGSVSPGLRPRAFVLASSMWTSVLAPLLLVSSWIPRGHCGWRRRRRRSGHPWSRRRCRHLRRRLWSVCTRARSHAWDGVAKIYKLVRKRTCACIDPALGQAASDLWWCCSRMRTVVLGSCPSESAWCVWWCDQCEPLQWEVLRMRATAALKIRSPMLADDVAKRWEGNSGAHNLWRHALAPEPRVARQGLESGLILIFYWLIIASITCNSNLVSLLEGLCSSNPCRFEFSGFWGFAGIERTTSGLTVPRSDQLSYFTWSRIGLLGTLAWNKLVSLNPFKKETCTH